MTFDFRHYHLTFAKAKTFQMLELNFIRENPNVVIERLAVKNFDAAALVGKIIALDFKRRDTKYFGCCSTGQQL